MKYIILFVLALMPATICVSVSGYLAIHGLSGWGWFLFVGLLLSSVSFSSKEDKK